MKIKSGGLYRFITLIFILLFLFGCSTSKIEKEESEEKTDELVKETADEDFIIETKNIYSWINLMPGSEPRFNITGDINLAPSLENDYSSLKLNRISIIQDSKTVFEIIPTVREGKWIKSEGREFVFSTIKGILLTTDFESENNIDIELQFTDGQSTYKYKIMDKKVEKVY